MQNWRIKAQEVPQSNAKVYMYMFKSTKVHICKIPLQMNPVTVNFYTDSRGGGLHSFIKETNKFTKDDAHVVVQAGGTIDHLTKLMKNKVKSLQQTFFGTICMIMAAGICNFTEKVKLPNHQFQIIYQHSEEKITEIKSKLSYLYEFMSKNNVFFKAVHIPSSNLLLSKQFSISKGKLSNETCIFSDIELIEQQTLLELAISNVNQHISDLNTKYLRRSVHWDQNLLLCKQKIRGHHGTNKKNHQSITYDNLYDGVHPNTNEARKWSTFLCKSVEFDIEDIVRPNAVNHSQSDTWDFKRIR